MNGVQQLKTLGASATAQGDTVVIRTQTPALEMTPVEAQRFAFYLARAYGQAGRAQRTLRGNFVLTRGGHVSYRK